MAGHDSAGALSGPRRWWAALTLLGWFGSEAALAQELWGSIDPAAVAEAFSAIGPAEIVEQDGAITLVGSITGKDGSALDYTGPLYSCDDAHGCGNLSLRFDWTGGERVRCILDAWKARYEGEDRAKPLYAFDDIRVMNEVFAYGDVQVDFDELALAWQRDLRAFDTLTRNADALCG